MSTHPKKQFSGMQQDRSDVLSLLQSIETMYNTCQNVLNTYTQTTLMLAITIEAQMLLRKLHVMNERWACHLPFKEACTVDFYEWSKKVEAMSLSLVGPDETGEAGEILSEYCPSKHFMLDLYTMLTKDEGTDSASDYFREQDIPKFINSQDKILKLITKRWADYKYKFSDMIAEEVDKRVCGALKPVADRSVTIRMTCYDVLRQLSIELNQLYNMPKGTIQRDQFACLAERVINEAGYGGRKAQQSARRDVDHLKDITPEEEWEERCDNEIKASIDFINELKYGRRVFTYLGRNYDIKGRYAGFGKFLNSVRKDISVEELSLLIEQLYRILYFREDIEQQEAEKNETQVPADDQPVAKNAMAVYKRRLEMKPQRPRLPYFFDDRLVNNADAVGMFYDIFHHCGFYIGRTLIEKEKVDKDINVYAEWKWKHVREAFISLGFIRKDTTKQGFAEYLVSVFPSLSVDGVKRGFNKRSTYEDSNAFDRIVYDIQFEFQPVIDMLEDASQKKPSKK